MKVLVAYSSRTGNTAKVAKAIYEALDVKKDIADIADIADNPEISGYDLIIVGCWINKGNVNSEARKFFKKITNSSVACFVTLGVYPNSRQGKYCRRAVEKSLKKRNNNFLGSFLCQGTVSQKIISVLSLLPKFLYGASKNTPVFWEAAASHPNEDDFSAATEWTRKLLESLNN